MVYSDVVNSGYILPRAAVYYNTLQAVKATWIYNINGAVYLSL